VRTPGHRASKWLIGSIVGVLVLAGVVVGLLLKHSGDQAHARKVAADKSSASVSAASARAAASRSAASASSASAAAAARSLAAEKRAAERALRDEMVREMERSITKDARKDVADGILDGPILSTDCTPTNGGSTDDLSARTTGFSCLAVTSKNASDGTEEGYRFSALMNWSAGTYSWHLGD
jgi:membrane protein involved in colicin uptake